MVSHKSKAPPRAVGDALGNVVHSQAINDRDYNLPIKEIQRIHLQRRACLRPERARLLASLIFAEVA